MWNHLPLPEIHVVPLLDVYETVENLVNLSGAMEPSLSMFVYGWIYCPSGYQGSFYSYLYILLFFFVCKPPRAGHELTSLKIG